nr:hypothetical protein L204_05934 [Cryptococcus depauperatus CBS 7855]
MRWSAAQCLTSALTPQGSLEVLPSFCRPIPFIGAVRRSDAGRTIAAILQSPKRKSTIKLLPWRHTFQWTEVENNPLKAIADDVCRTNSTIMSTIASKIKRRIGYNPYEETFGLIQKFLKRRYQDTAAFIRSKVSDEQFENLDVGELSRVRSLTDARSQFIIDCKRNSSLSHIDGTYEQITNKQSLSNWLSGCQLGWNAPSTSPVYCSSLMPFPQPFSQHDSPTTSAFAIRLKYRRGILGRITFWDTFYLHANFYLGYVYLGNSGCSTSKTGSLISYPNECIMCNQ